jgi:prefoldin subunit 5
MDLTHVLNAIDTIASEAAVLGASVTRLQALAKEAAPLIQPLRDELASLSQKRDEIKAELEQLGKQLKKKSK